MNKNTDPKKLDETNKSDAAVVTLDNGDTISATITDVHRNIARFEWRAGPRPMDYLFVWIRRAQWLDRVKLFPANASFFVPAGNGSTFFVA